MRTLRRIALAFGVLTGAAAYVWVAAARAVPGVRRRKAEVRAARRVS